MSSNDMNNIGTTGKFPCQCPPVSGLYERKIPYLPRIPLPRPIPVPFPKIPIPIPDEIPDPFPGPIPGPDPFPKTGSATAFPQLDFGILPLFLTEELRLDVDNRYPLMVASGVMKTFPFTVSWIANLYESGGGWSGKIWYKDGDTTFFPYTVVTIYVRQNANQYPSQATCVFSDGISSTTKVFNYKSPYFHDVNFEFDFETDNKVTTSVNTCGHPNRPAQLSCEILSVEEVFRRSGFNVTTNQGGVVPLAQAGANLQWSNQEMHDAMQTYWSRWGDIAQWAMWVFFASQHEWGSGLGGIMFDSIGPNHRQGTAIFNNSFIADAPDGDSNPDEWVQRNIFWTTCHEMGHAFNLAHAWQKSWGSPWIPLSDDSEARSFMNYPYSVIGGESAFFSDFEYRFGDEELLFMRHAPSRFVEMGNEDWFSNHGFWSPNSSNTGISFEIRVNREDPIFDYMEPVIVEFKLKNVSDNPILVDENLFTSSDAMTILIRKEDNNIKEFKPYAKYCYKSKQQALLPGNKIYYSQLISVGNNGWYISDPGKYQIQAILHLNGQSYATHPLTIHVLPAFSREETIFGVKYFTDDVGRILTFGGSKVLTNGMEVLKKLAETLPQSKVAKHANFVLGNTNSVDYKLLKKSDDGKTLKIVTENKNLSIAKDYLNKALTDNSDISIETFGHIEFNNRMSKFSKLLVNHNQMVEAKTVLETLLNKMNTRIIKGKKILKSVLDNIEQEKNSI